MHNWTQCSRGEPDVAHFIRNPATLPGRDRTASQYNVARNYLTTEIRFGLTVAPHLYDPSRPWDYQWGIEIGLPQGWHMGGLPVSYETSRFGSGQSWEAVSMNGVWNTIKAIAQLA